MDTSITISRKNCVLQNSGKSAALDNSQIATVCAGESHLDRCTIAHGETKILLNFVASSMETVSHT